jgi:hypothetical protein
MSNRIILPHKAAMEEVTVYYHPTLDLWTPNHGEPITLEVYGKTSTRAGQSRWTTDLISVSEGQLPFMKHKALRTLIASVITALCETLPETKINEIMQHVVDYAE